MSQLLIPGFVLTGHFCLALVTHISRTHNSTQNFWPILNRCLYRSSFKSSLSYTFLDLHFIEYVRSLMSPKTQWSLGSPVLTTFSPSPPRASTSRVGSGTWGPPLGVSRTVRESFNAKQGPINVLRPLTIYPRRLRRHGPCSPWLFHLDCSTKSSVLSTRAKVKVFCCTGKEMVLRHPTSRGGRKRRTMDDDNGFSFDDLADSLVQGLKTGIDTHPPPPLGLWVVLPPGEVRRGPTDYDRSVGTGCVRLQSTGENSDPSLRPQRPVHPRSATDEQPIHDVAEEWPEDQRRGRPLWEEGQGVKWRLHKVYLFSTFLSYYLPVGARGEDLRRQGVSGTDEVDQHKIRLELEHKYESL